MAEHGGRYQSRELASGKFIFDKLSEEKVHDIVACGKCQWSKLDKHGRQTKLVPIPTVECPLMEKPMDFVRELPKTKGINTILVVTDQFTKVQALVSARTTCTVADIADAYMDNI